MAKLIVGLAILQTRIKMYIHLKGVSVPVAALIEEMCETLAVQ
jgi:uncharacterized protein YwlG (UPF0340 family)